VPLGTRLGRTDMFYVLVLVGLAFLIGAAALDRRWYRGSAYIPGSTGSDPQMRPSSEVRLGRHLWML